MGTSISGGKLHLRVEMDCRRIAAEQEQKARDEKKANAPEPKPVAVQDK